MSGFGKLARIDRDANSSQIVRFGFRAKPCATPSAKDLIISLTKIQYWLFRAADRPKIARIMSNVDQSSRAGPFHISNRLVESLSTLLRLSCKSIAKENAMHHLMNPLLLLAAMILVLGIVMAFRVHLRNRRGNGALFRNYFGPQYDRDLLRLS